MATQFVLSDYLRCATERAEYDILEDGSFFGHIPPCPGVVAFSMTLAECEDELRSVLEEWALLGIQQGHQLPLFNHRSWNEL